MENADYTNLGALAIIFIFSVKEFFAYLKSKRNGNGNGYNKAILDELQAMNSNHLHAIQETIEGGNRQLIDTMGAGTRQLIDTIHQDNMKIIEALGEIRGRLK